VAKKLSAIALSLVSPTEPIVGACLCGLARRRRSGGLTEIGEDRAQGSWLRDERDQAHLAVAARGSGAESVAFSHPRTACPAQAVTRGRKL
jgi:hypothetical protein